MLTMKKKKNMYALAENGRTAWLKKAKEKK